jgi:hypothetical protein
MTDWLDLCPKCINRHVCIYLKRNRIRQDNAFCPGLAAFLDNNTPLREPLARDVIHEQYEQFVSRDYKDVFNEVSESTEQCHVHLLEAIESLSLGVSDKDQRLRAVLCLLWFGMPVRAIMQVLRVGRSAFYELVREAKGRVN